MIHNVFNEDLLTRCVEPKFQEQHRDPAPHLRLLMKKKNMKWKKYGSTENEDGKLSTWCIGRAMEMNTING